MIIITTPRLLKTLLLLVVIGALSSCDSSVGTSNNPDLKTNDGSYTGPPARTADIRSFQLNFWQFMKEDNRCGQCHGGNQSPTFVNLEDVNKAYSEAVQYTNLRDPASSILVSKVGGGHQCWLTSLSACETTIEQMISNWANDSNVTSARLIQLTPPALRDPGASKSFPPAADTAGTNGSSFENSVYPLLVGTTPVIANNNCQDCHRESGPPLPQAPFFGSMDVDSAYAAARSKMNINSPGNSRFVERLQQLHNCWTNCTADAAAMTAVIKQFADGIVPTTVDGSLRTSKALLLSDGIVASGGNRHEANLVAIWEFKTRSGNTAFDTSGIDPAVDLRLISDVDTPVTWLGGYGLNFGGGRAQALTFTTEKLHSFIQSTGEYAVEAWLVPANVDQQDANIISYSGSDNARNFTLGQNLYNYDFYNRIVSAPAELNGEPFLSTGENGEEVAQATLQHVVMNYDPDVGRSIYVNGILIDVSDPLAGPSTINNVWDPGFTLVLGNETSGNRPWQGQMRMLAIHNRNLSASQVQQNYDVGVGEKFFLLFYVGHRIGIDDSYIMLEVSRFDEYSYLFSTPTFVNLDPNWTPVSVDIVGMRIGINGKEALTGQAFANLNTRINSSYDPQLGQVLSSQGTIITLENGPDSDEFFLTFEKIGSLERDYTEALPAIPSDPLESGPVSPLDSDIGVRTFQEINTTIAEMTGVPVINGVVNSVYSDYIQQLPSVEAIDAFLPSHQMAIAQLSLTSCSELVNTELPPSTPVFFAGFDFTQTAQEAFGPVAASVVNPTAIAMEENRIQANRDLVITRLLTATMNVDPLLASNNLSIHPAQSDISDLLGAKDPQFLDATIAPTYDSLISQLIVTCTPAILGGSCTPENTAARTAQIVKAVCAATVGSAVMVVQ